MGYLLTRRHPTNAVKRDDILAARRPRVDQSFGPPVFLHAENLPVKSQRALNISNHKVNMR